MKSKTKKKEQSEIIQFNYCPVLGFYITYIPSIPIELNKKLIR